jgi:hypothetical protein
VDKALVRVIEWDCAQLVLRFYGLLDAKRYDELVALFSKDGVWVRMRKPLSRSEIMATQSERENWVTAHVVTNLQVHVIDEDHAETQQYITLYRQENWADSSGVPPVSPPRAILRHHDRLVRENGAWKIAHKRSVPIFMGEREPSQR